MFNNEELEELVKEFQSAAGDKQGISELNVAALLYNMNIEVTEEIIHNILLSL